MEYSITGAYLGLTAAAPLEEIMEKAIGILGGMDPEAGLDCFEKIMHSTPAKKDQDHLHVILNSDPKIPDRTAAITAGGPSPTPALVRGVEALERAGADFVIIPCVSAHVFLEEIISRVNPPIISIFDAVAEAVSKKHPSIKKLGLLATSGTITGGLFQRRLAEEGLETITPSPEAQDQVMAAIYSIKESTGEDSRKQAAEKLVKAGHSLLQGGAEAIVAGCTEIPLVLHQSLFTVPYFDAVLELAKAAIRRAGVEPKQEG